jgi:TRAP-type C4-dicarboxylate transport system permease small subunit
MTKILLAVDAVSKFVAALSALLTVSIAVVIISEVAARSLFNYSFSFAWEYSAYAMGVAMFGGAAYTLRTGGHIRVSLLASAMPAKAAHWTDILCTLVGLFFVGFISKALIELAWKSFQNGSTSPTVSETPLIIPQGLIAFGATLLTLQIIVRLVRLFINEEPEDTSVSFQVD